MEKDLNNLENARLRKELAEVKLDLEIESALERVRTVAMGMRVANDLLNICQVLFEEFKALGFVDLRNAMINILHDEKGYFLDYDFNDSGASVTPFLYNSHPMMERQVELTRSATDAFIEHSLTGDELEDFKAFRERNGEPPDPKLENISGLYYYFYSIGVGSVGISTFNPLIEEKREVLKRFRNVFDLAYRRYMDITNAEAQAREAQIEATLEKIRSRSLAMHKSEELHEVVVLLAEKLKDLDVNMEGAVICLPVDDNRGRGITMWAAMAAQAYAPALFVPFGHPYIISFSEGWETGIEFVAKSWGYEEKTGFWKWAFEHSDFRYIPEGRKDQIMAAPAYALSTAFAKHSAITIPSHKGQILSEDEGEILKRFAKVFDQAYVRFLDLQKAEAQAREAQIELALERVRARTMAMYHSEELAETAHVLFQQLSELGNEPARISIGIMDQEKGEVSFWATDQDGAKIDISFTAPISEKTTISKMYAGWSAKLKSLSIELQGKELAAWVRFCREYMGIIIRDELLQKRRVHTVGYFSQGWINYTTHAPLSSETTQILERFATMFSYTYTRFLDLQKAEAQARESKIQLGLERVRAKAMAMQTSEELNELIGAVFSELTKLDFVLTRCLIMIFDPETKASRWWMANSEAPAEPMNYLVQNHKNPAYDAYLKAWKERNLKWRYLLKGKVKKNWDDFLFIDTELAQLPAPVIAGMKAPEQVLLSASFNNFGCLTLVTLEPLSDEHSDIMLRFAKVFDMCYTRFNDLKQAEEQAKESQIQLALERVRARTMAMQHSDELAEAASVLFQQVQSLGIPSWSCGYNIWKKGDKFCTSWMSNKGQAQPPFDIPFTEYPTFKKFAESKKNKEDLWIEEFGGKELKKQYEYLLSLPGTEKVDAKNKQSGLTFPDFQVNHFVNFSNGNLLFITYQPVPEAHDIFRRFAAVFEQTYTRFLDLQKAEAQAREAQIEAALERVRAAAMAMHDSKDVGNATALVFSELYKLGITTIRCGVCILDGPAQQMEVWSANSSANGIVNRGAGKLDMKGHALWLYLLDAWQQKKSSFSYELAGKELTDYYKAIKNAPGYQAPESIKLGKLSETSQYCNCYLFNDGCIFSFTQAPFSSEANQVLEKFAAVFGLTYRRYLDLTKAEAQARESQIQLALERVRARTMAMQHSEELAETVYILFQQFKDLGENPDQATIGIINEEEHVIEYWVTMHGNQDNRVFKFSIDEPNVTRKIYNAWKQHKKSLVIDLSGKALIDFMTYRAGKGGAAVNKAEKRRMINVALFSKGLINVQSTAERSPESILLLERFAQVFEGTYTRFLDLKKAEEQAREGQIELSLERLRAKTMAMHTSEHVGETVATMFDELVKLGIDSTARCGIAIVSDDREMELWRASYNTNGEVEMLVGRVDMTIHPLLEEVYQAWKNNQVSYSYELTGKDQENYFRALNDSPDYAAQFDLAALPAKQTNIDFFFPEGCVYAFTINPLSEDEARLFKRFAGVFGLTYRRYLDLQKAENQAREARIEAALERVRSRTMAMQKSDELAEVIQVVYDQLCQLNFNIDNANFVVNYKESNDLDLWLAVTGQRYSTKIHIPYLDHPIFNRLNEAKVKGLSFFSDSLTFEEKNTFFRHLFENAPQIPQERKKAVFNGQGYARSVVLMNTIALSIQNYAAIPYSEAENAVLARFGKVFEQTYTRFLDLQKAETQAKEAKIEASLERVRSKTMAMHNSQDVGETVATMFDELVNLGVEKAARCGILIIDATKHMEVWTASYNADGQVNMLIGRIDMMIHPLLQNIHKAWGDKAATQPYELSGNDLRKYYKAINDAPEYLIQYDLEALPEKQFTNVFFFPEGAIFSFSLEQLTIETAQLFKRFAGVFGLTYRRYLDLQKAEMQTREAHIEAALERVRGRAMAMHISEDLTSTASMVFTELKRLGIRPLRCGVGLIDKETYDTALYAATGAEGEENLELMGRVMVSGHPVLAGIYDHWVKNEDYFPELHGKSLKAYYEQLQLGFTLPDWQHGEKIYGNFIPFSEGCLYAWAEEPLARHDIKILKRFTTVIDLTFKRYMELQRSEANARDAIKEASLDRVRAEIASMRTPKDLERITPLMCEELATLAVPFIRCGVFIIDEQQELIHTYLSTPDGRALAAFDLAFDSEGIGRDVLPAWRKKQMAAIHWSEEEFATYTKNLVAQGTINPEERYVTEHPDTSLDLHFVPFLQGMLYVGNIAPLTESEINLVKSLATAFSTAYARYEDFNKLEAAKQQVDNTLTELKAAQAKLIQSEKMASLGELTAGIAHEIQNPLNFVNNFSEVSVELIAEMGEELDKGNLQEAHTIAEDIKQNLEKIRHHGKRADSIVKGMLEHSRVGTGIRQPTDLNILADEFLKLTYHGLRAKDKSFNAELITNFDAMLPKASVVQQDIGRVFINLFNNAFYAVNQKSKTGKADYKPAVSVTTLAENGHVIIKIKDNGNGIPDAIKDKIMQPFFTTKPTGEGTGLGLSLSYDIVVKGHGGSIQVNSVEGKGSEFIIQLPTG